MMIIGHHGGLQRVSVSVPVNRTLIAVVIRDPLQHVPDVASLGRREENFVDL